MERAGRQQNLSAIVFNMTPLIQNSTTFITAAVIFISAFVPSLHAQDIAPSVEFNPERYVSYKASDSLDIDGILQEKSWEKAEWTEYFLDIEGETKPDPRFNTRVKMLWDDKYFYIAARLEEPHLWATLTERDAIIFHENNFEVFIDPTGDTHNYYELEINALGTYWDLMLTKPYRDGGRAIDAWDIRGLKTGIDLNGTLNNPTDIDSGWTVELAIPWNVLEEAAPKGRPPGNGEIWRVNFSRVQWQIEERNGQYVKKSDTEDNWVWSPQGLINMHYPEMWGYVQFSENTTSSSQKTQTSFDNHSEEQMKWYLRKLYYRQHKYHEKHGAFADQLKELSGSELRKKMRSKIYFDQWLKPEIYATDHTFEISIEHQKSGEKWYIREDGRVWEAE